MSTALASLTEQQNHLLTSLFAARADATKPIAFNAPSRGLAAYRANAHATAQGALQAVYPVLEQLIGADNFAYLARYFWCEHPPQRGDLAQWGEGLAAYVAASAQLADTPYLADVAQIEWALHVCALAEDRLQDTASFALLTEHDPQILVLRVAPGACVLHSAYPAAAITLAHQHLGSLQEAASLLHAGTAQSALVWRQGFAPRLRVLDGTELALTNAVCKGDALSMALDAAHPDLDFSTWLATQVGDGLLLGVDIISPPSDNNRK
jgi:Putative DNA-binding domain